MRWTRRPVPLKHRLHATGEPLFDLGRVDWVTKRLSSRGGGRGRRGRRSHHRSERRGRRQGFQPGDLAQLFDHLHSKKLLPALVFSFSRRDCERLAASNQGRKLLSADEREKMEVTRAVDALYGTGTTRPPALSIHLT